MNLSLNQTLFALGGTWMTQLILAITLWGLSSFNPKRCCCSCAWSCSLCEGKTSFCPGLFSRKVWRYLFMFLTGLLLLESYFIFLYQPPSSLCKVFETIVFNIDEVLLINPSDSVLSWEILTFIIRTD